MGEIISIVERLPHVTGPAICTRCNHEWIVIAPITVDRETLECPSCKCYHGVFRAPFVPEEFYTCECGSTLYYVTRTNPVCRMCGVEVDVDG